MAGVVVQDKSENFLKISSDGTLTIYKDVTVLASQARTTSGEFILTDNVGNYDEIVSFLNVTAASGTTPTLNVKFQTLDPTSGTWFDIAELTFVQKTAVGNEKKEKIGGLGSKLKCVYTIGGTTPSFTFSVGAVLKSK